MRVVLDGDVNVFGVFYLNCEDLFWALSLFLLFGSSASATGCCCRGAILCCSSSASGSGAERRAGGAFENAAGTLRAGGASRPRAEGAAGAAKTAAASCVGARGGGVNAGAARLRHARDRLKSHADAAASGTSANHFRRLNDRFDSLSINLTFSFFFPP